MHLNRVVQVYTALKNVGLKVLKVKLSLTSAIQDFSIKYFYTIHKQLLQFFFSYFGHQMVPLSQENTAGFQTCRRSSTRFGYQSSDKILWLGIKSGFLYIEFYAEFKNLRKKKVINRSVNHFIKSGLELTKFRNFYEVICTSIIDLLISHIFEFSIKF